MLEEQTRKQRKPRQPSEILDTPRRYLVRSGFGTNHVLETETKPANSALMGTHEDQAHAEKRLGWQ